METVEKQTTNQIVTKAELRTGGAVAPIVPQDIEQAFRMATAITSADMAPKSFDRKAEKVLVAILHGMEVGMTPMAAVQSIAVINGNPSIWGDGALGLVLGSGLVEDIDEHMETTDDGAEIGALCIIKRKGRKTPIVGRFTWDDAERAKLTKKPGPWQDYPRRMIKMRARAFALRDGFADVLKGLKIGEEVRDTLEPDDTGTYTPRPQRSEYTPPRAEETIPETSEEDIEPEAVEAEIVEDAVEETDPAAAYRLAVHNKPNTKLSDWSRLRNEAVALVIELGPESIPHIEAANADLFQEMSDKGRQWFDAMWRDIGGLQQ